MDAVPRDPAASEAGAMLSEGALGESSERYASMFTHHPHAAYSVDRRGFYTDANPRALAMTGLSLAQMRQTHFSEVIHPDDADMMRQGFDLALTGEPQVREARVLRPDGEIVHIRTTAIPIVVGGTVVGVHGITEDITSAKEMVRKLEEANAAKSLFLATVGHEVRTPLAVLVGATDLLMHAELGPEAEHLVDMVHRSSQRLERLVNDILEFSGLEAHRAVVQPGPFEVRTVVEGVADWAAPLAESRTLTISFVVDDSVPATVVGDGQRVSQVVTNLVQNAIQFTEQGAVDVRVGCRTAAPDPDVGRGPDHWVEFAVTDTGIGIAGSRVHALFEPFTKVDPATAGEHRGIGLGLAICRELVDLMGGRLQVSSTIGEGSTFTFGVPLGHVTAGPAPSSSS